MSVPNQKIVTVHASKEVPFLKVGIEEWQKAYDNLRWADDTVVKKKKKSEPRVSTFAIYLYLAGNAEDFKLELSPKAIENALGISRTSYYRAIHELTILGYIYEDNNGCLNFAPSPKVGIRTQIQDWGSDESKVKHDDPNDETPPSQFRNKNVSDLDREINNKYEINNTDKINKAKDFSYLKDIVDPADGSYEYKGKHDWIDAGNRMFYEETEEQQLSEMIVNTPFNKEESLYILRNIMTQNDTEKTYESFKEYNNENELDEFDDWYYSDEQVMARKYRNWMKQECARIEKENITNFEEYE